MSHRGNVAFAHGSRNVGQKLIDTFKELLIVSLSNDICSAFWLLVTIVTDYLPTYFTKDRQGSLLDANIISYILQHGEPELHRHLNTRDGERKYAIVKEASRYQFRLFTDTILVPRHPPPPLVVTILQGWLASAFVRTLPWATQLRVMDLFFFGDRVSHV